MEVAIYPSQNGFGHTQRMIAISQHLINSPKISGINFYLSKSNLPIFAKSLNELGIRTVISAHPNKESEGPWVEESVNASTKTQNEALTICDTVIWPISNANKSILFANFLWEDYWDYLSSIKTIPFRKFETKRALRFKESIIFANSRFVTSSVSNSTNFIPLPVIDYWGLRLKDKFYEGSRRIEFDVIISLGGTGDMLEKVKTDLRSLNIKWLPSRNGIEESRNKNLNLIMIVRAGVGAISECVSAGVPTICLFDSSDPEISENAEIVARCGWGLAVDINSKNLIQEIELSIYEIKANYELFRGRILSEPVIEAESLAQMMIAEGCN